jgi:integrase/recombinase XerD
MPFKLSTIVKKIGEIPNDRNRQTVNEFLEYMRINGSSDNHQINNLKCIISFAKYLGQGVEFTNIKKREQILNFLNMKIKSQNEDPDKKWIGTWNNYLNRIRLFLRWLHNHSNPDIDSSDWKTPEFLRIKTLKTKRLSPYSENEIWEKDELLSVVKYEPHKRNKAILTLLWDLNARNHEISLLKLKHIRIREKYGEGEIPHEAKTGSGPILLCCSFPYVRDWLNEHPFRVYTIQDKGRDI